MKFWLNMFRKEEIVDREFAEAPFFGLFERH